MSDTPIENLLTTGERITAPAGVAAWAGIADQADWNAQTRRDPQAFWRACGEQLAWAQAPHATFEGSLAAPHWYPGGRLNVTVTCLDRQVVQRPEAIAYRYLREDGFESTTTYRELLAAVNRLANALAADGVRAGDRVCIYMPLSVEGIVAMLACARLGAVHSVVYAGLGATALRDRIADAGAEVVIAADVTYLRGRTIDLKKIVDDALTGLPDVRRTLVWRRASEPAPLGERERDFVAYVRGQSAAREAEIVDASAPLFIMYT